MKAKERYEALTKNREQFLQRARHNAMLTIPSLMPLAGHDGKAHLIEPYQSLGAEGATSLSSRITLALIPAGRPHLRLDIPPLQLMEMGGEVAPEIQQNLAKGEKLIQAAVEAANWRADTLAVMQQLVVVGSVTEEMMEDDTIRVHRLDNFVWRRDYRGRMLECIIREFWDRNALPDGVAAAAGQNTSLEAKDVDDVEVYAVIRLMDSDKDGLFYEVHKETAEGAQVEPKKQFKMDELRYLFLRWSKTPGEDYGRAKIEEVIGDLRSLDSLSKQSLEQGAMGAKNFTMVRPGATANGLKNRLSRINNGDIVLGDPESVELKSFASQGGYQITSDQIEKLEARLARAFLLQSGAAQRNAERVTATEIERDIQELEATLGGVFSALSLEMLEKRTALLIEDMKARGEFPDAAKEDLQTTILTGLEALSRERDVGRGVQAAQILGQFGEEGFKRVKVEVLLNSILTGLGFPDAIRDEADVQAADQRQQQAALLEKAAGPAAGALAKGAADGGAQ
jgi:hypothetical protein